MNKFITIFIVLVITLISSCTQQRDMDEKTSLINVTSNPAFKQVDQIEFKVIKGLGITTDGKRAYVLELLESGYAINVVKIEDGKVKSERLITLIRTSKFSPHVIHINGSNWNITLKGLLSIYDIFSFNNSIYAAGIDIVKVKDGKVMWIKRLIKGTEDKMSVLNMKYDGEYVYHNTGDCIVKTDDNLNVIWAVKIFNKTVLKINKTTPKINETMRKKGIIIKTPPNEIVHNLKLKDIAVSDGVYGVGRLCENDIIIKLNKNGEIEWAIALKSDEKIRIRHEISLNKSKIDKSKLIIKKDKIVIPVREAREERDFVIEIKQAKSAKEVLESEGWKTNTEIEVRKGLPIGSGITLWCDHKGRNALGEKDKRAEKGKIEVFVIEIEKYSVDFLTLYAEDYVYVAGIIEDLTLTEVNKRKPFVAKLSADGNIVWVRILNTSTERFIIGKILKYNERTFIALISSSLLIFDENGKIIDYYEVNGVCDIGLIGNTILLTSVEPEEVKIKKKEVMPIQIDIKAVKRSIEIKHTDKDKIKLVERYNN